MARRGGFVEEVAEPGGERIVRDVGRHRDTGGPMLAVGAEVDQLTGARAIDDRHRTTEDRKPVHAQRRPHQAPVFAIDAHGSAGASGPPFCSSSTEIRSGERTKAMWPSRGGRLMV